MDPPPAVVFVTALADSALAALEAGAAAYLVKPVGRERLAEALARARRPSRAQLAALSGGAGRSHIAVRVGRDIRLVPVADIHYFRAADKTTVAVYPEGEVTLDDPLTALESEFAAQFLRIRRNLLVSRRAITGLVRSREGSRVELISGDSLPVSRRHLRRLAAALEGGRR